MSTIFRRSALVGLIAVSSAAAAVAAPPVHIRGTIQSVKGNVLTVLSSSGPVRVTLTANLPVVSVIPADRSQIKDGTFLGIASVPGASGAQNAREVVVFPEAARGTGEGSYDWDLPGGSSAAPSASRMTNGTASHSRMTNGTVSHSISHSMMTNGTARKSRMTNGSVTKSSGGALTLTYKNGATTGSQTISLPANIPIVTLAPGSPAQLKPGAHVFVVGHGPAGAVVADRILVGKDGLVPPM